MPVSSVATLTTVNSFRRTDAEFFNPRYLAAESAVLRCTTDRLGRLGNFLTGPFGSAFHVSGYDASSPFRYVRGQDVKPFFLQDDANRTIPESVFHRLKKYALREGDILISVVGTLGNASIVTSDAVPGIFSCKSTSFRTNDIDPYFLIAYLNSQPGLLCTLRRQRGAIQTGLNIEDLETIPVPRFGKDIEFAIGNRIREARVALLQSREAYASAQQLLETELGLDQLTYAKTAGYTVQFSVLQTSRRADADFHNPELRWLWQELSQRCEMRKMTTWTTPLKFANPEYGDTGVPIITQKHLRAISPEGYGSDLLTTDAWARNNPNAQLRKNDLLFYSVGAYLGKTNIWLNNDAAVPASFITLLRCFDEGDAGYLQVLLNSRYGLLQSKCFQSGTSQQYIYPKDIRNFLIPVVESGIRERISELVVASYGYEQRSKKLLDEAKARIETIIEEAVQR
jgi:type I restriction enzyme S subunit